jgi:predicted MPP superfamily phosphohydrolase
MSETWRIAVFVSVVLAIWAVMHAYLLWRVATVPTVAEHVPRTALVLVFVLLALAYPLARILDMNGITAVAYPLELVGAIWMGLLFLAIIFVFAADVLALVSTLAADGLKHVGVQAPTLGPSVRLGAVGVALLLGAIGLGQCLRGPVVQAYEVKLAGLPAERDGMVLVAVSDLHLGSLLGPRWFAKRVAQIEALKPDMVAVVGDLIDGSARRTEIMLPELRRLKAPLGVWAVMGNHEFYADRAGGGERSAKLLEAAGYTVLRDRWAEAVPGLVLAGVDDLTARRQFGIVDDPLVRALKARPAGATILLSHSPLQADEAAAAGVGLMLSGHTHDGQIWPFGYLVKRIYPLLGGRYQVGGMTAIVCRGTGTWGPPLRLWRPSEILKLTLRAG